MQWCAKLRVAIFIFSSCSCSIPQDGRLQPIFSFRIFFAAGNLFYLFLAEYVENNKSGDVMQERLCGRGSAPGTKRGLRMRYWHMPWVNYKLGARNARKTLGAVPLAALQRPIDLVVDNFDIDLCNRRLEV